VATSSAQTATPATPGLQQRYNNEVLPALQKEFNYDNVMQVPALHKVVINIGMGEAIQNAKAMENAVRDLTDITGQRPVVTKAKRSVAAFKLREGMPIGAMVTLRGRHMYDFLDKLINVALPRLRDFQGVSADSFDGRGNYTLGIREQLVFPEINYDKIDKVRGMEITIVTTARTDEEGRRLLRLLGMPFKSGR
jgi:large subunit ribosomal protein L5